MLALVLEAKRRYLAMVLEAEVEVEPGGGCSLDVVGSHLWQLPFAVGTSMTR